MKQLIDFLQQSDALTCPADAVTIDHAQQQLNMTFADDYTALQQNIGVISYRSHEVFGLGVKESAWLNILRSTPELRAENAAFPASAVPLMDAGDGQFYLYDNDHGTILVWSSLAGIIETQNVSLEAFLLTQLAN